ncbi:MAG: radical SAM protein, partial [Desulfurivibrionaceae bacterium]
MPLIKGFLETSFIDWPGKLCAILFVGGCNFRCPFCHNHPLVLAPEGMETLAFTEIMSRLAARRNWLAGICISGGEPTLSPGLPKMIARLKAEGWAVKLD